MDLKHLAAEYGVANLRFFIPMSRLEYVDIIPGIAFRSSDSPREMAECTVSETRYKVSDGYKITLVAVDPAFGVEHYYQSDLRAILHSHPTTHRVFVLTIDGYAHIPGDSSDVSI